MKIKYLGTAASEGVPSAFCNCDNCKLFRKVGGKNLRARTQALIDGKILIDFNEDTYMNIRLDFIGFDCTYVNAPANTHGSHMSLYDDALQYDILKENKLVDDKTKVILTHFSHWHMLLHEELQKVAGEFGFTVAYDGIEINI